MKSIQRIPEIENNIIERYYALGNRAPIFEQNTHSIKMPNQNNREFQYEFFKYDNSGGLHIEYTHDKIFSVLGTEKGQITYQTKSDDLDDIMFELYRSEMV